MELFKKKKKGGGGGRLRLLDTTVKGRFPFYNVTSNMPDQKLVGGKLKFEIKDHNDATVSRHYNNCPTSGPNLIPGVDIHV